MLMYVLALTVVAADRSEADEPAVKSAPAPESSRRSAPAPHRRAHVTRPPRRPVDAPRPPQRTAGAGFTAAPVRRPLSAGSRWPRRLRGPHVRDAGPHQVDGHDPQRHRYGGRARTRHGAGAKRPLVPSAPAKCPTPAGHRAQLDLRAGAQPGDESAQRGASQRRGPPRRGPRAAGPGSRRTTAVSCTPAGGVGRTPASSGPAASANASLATSLETRRPRICRFPRRPRAVAIACLQQRASVNYAGQPGPRRGLRSAREARLSRRLRFAASPRGHTSSTAEARSRAGRWSCVGFLFAPWGT